MLKCSDIQLERWIGFISDVCLEFFSSVYEVVITARNSDTEQGPPGFESW